MPRQISVYLIDELEDSAKKNAIAEVRVSGVCVDSDDITTLFQDVLKEKGFPIDDVSWSLNCCQGDGMAFYGVIEQLEPIAKRLGFSEEEIAELNRLGIADAKWKIVRNSFGHRYSHWNTMDLDVESFYNRTDEPNVIDKLEKAVREEIQSVSRDLESRGYAGIEDAESDEACLDIARSNEYYFTSSGKRWVEA